MPTTLTLIGRDGCHLCDDARDAVLEIAGPFGDRVEVVEQSIDDDPDLMRRFAEEIPVVLIDGRVHVIYRVDRPRLQRALEDAARAD